MFSELKDDKEFNVEDSREDNLNINTPIPNKNVLESSNDGELLMERNASILIMLPSLLQNLFFLDYNSRALLRYFEFNDRLEGDDKNENYLQLKLQVEVLVNGKKIANDKQEAVTVDQNKTILMSFLLGSCYNEALEILSNKDNVNIEILCPDEDDAQRLGNYYLNHFRLPDDCNGESVMIKVIQNLPISNDNRKKHISAIKSRLHFLEIKALLEKVGMSLNSNGTIVPQRDHIGITDTSGECRRLREKITAKLNIEVEENIVDLNNWYCSCKGYQNHYINKGTNRLSNEDANLSKGIVMASVEELIKPLLEVFSTSIIGRLLSQCNTKILDPIPICPHILAMLILLHNKDVNPSYNIHWVRVERFE